MSLSIHGHSFDLLRHKCDFRLIYNFRQNEQFSDKIGSKFDCNIETAMGSKFKI